MPPSASQKEIIKAYHRLAKRYHPDKHQGNLLEDLAKEKLMELNEAYDVLSNPSKKQVYDNTNYNQSATPSPKPDPKTPIALKGIRQLIFLIILMAAFPVIIRFVKTPKALLVIAAVTVLAWFGPRLIKKLKKH